MRGLVMEVKKNSLIVLTDKGEYLRIKNDGHSAIGDMVPFDVPSHQPVVSLRMPRQLVTMAASFILLCTAGLGAYGYSQPFGVVNVDINPSVALTYNWFSRVIGVEALDADAELILPQIGNINNSSVPEAVDAVVTAASNAGYLKPELANIIFVSVSDKNDSTRTTSLMNAIEKSLPAVAGKSETVLLKGSHENYEKAHTTHDSVVPDLIEKSIDSDTRNDPSIFSHKPVKEILKDQQIKRNEVKPSEKKPDSSSEKPNKPDSPDGSDKHSTPDNDKTPEHKPSNSPNPNSDKNKSDADDSHILPLEESPPPENTELPQDHQDKDKKQENHDLKKNQPLPH